MNKNEMLTNLSEAMRLIEEVTESLYQEEIDNGEMNEKYDEIVNKLDDSRVQVRRMKMLLNKIKQD